MVLHPNRRNLDNKFFLDFDEIMILFPVPIKYPDSKDPSHLKNGWAVDGFTKCGLRISSFLGGYLFTDFNPVDNKKDTCVEFINNFWMTK